MADVSAILAELDSAIVWDLREAADGSAGKGKVATPTGDVCDFLRTRAGARERADAIVLGPRHAESEASPALYKQIMFGGLLKPGGFFLVDASSDELLLNMVKVDVQASVLHRKNTEAQGKFTVVELSKGWSPGMPTPSMSGPMEPETLAAVEKIESDSGLRQRKPAGDDKSAQQAATPACSVSQDSPWAERRRTLSAIVFLWACAPLLVLWALVAWVRHRLFGQALKQVPPEKQLRILVTGGKMSKASAVARAVGRDGHKVFTAEISPYEYCHTRFCAYVSKHYVLPRPTVQPKEWEEAIQSIVKEQKIDLIIPCTAPVESSAYAHLRERLPPNVRVFAFDGATSDELDNKFTFNQVLVKAGLKCPETAKMECIEDAVEFFRNKQSKPDDGKRYIVKPGVYDPKARTEILFLPIPDAKKQLDYLRSRNASKSVPYVIQEVLEDPEYGSFAIYNKGHLTGFEFFKSAASCLVYRRMVGKHYDALLELHRGLGKAMNLTGQLTLDFMWSKSGDLVPIECNPRIHSAVSTLEGHKRLGECYTNPDYVPQSIEDVAASEPSTFRYWLMDQLFLMAGFWKPKNCIKLSLSEMFRGNDAILCGDDPMPFLAMYLLQIPWLLMLELRPGTKWLKVDFCIGKVVKEGGD